jgi:DNA-binding CsgD family transcriptional regulator
MLRAASSAWAAGHPARARALASAASDVVTEPRTGIRLLVLRGQIEWNTRSLEDGCDLVVRAARSAAELEGPGGRTALELAMLAASLAAFREGVGQDDVAPLDVADLVAQPAPDAPAAVRITDLLLRGFLSVARHDWRGAAALREALELAETAPSEERAAIEQSFLQPNLGIAALHLGDDVRGMRLHTEQLVAARRAGAIDMVEHALRNGALFQISSGAWGAAASAAEESLTLASGTGQPALTALPQAELATVAALRGEAERADSLLDQVTALLDHRHIGVTESLVANLARWGRGLRAPQPDVALHHFEQMAGPGLPRAAAIDRVEVAVRAGRRDHAERWVSELAEFADGTGMAFASAAAEHGRALLADGAEAERHFEQALEEHTRSPRVVDAARTRLAYGEWLRRARRRVDAREHLRVALTTFEEIGATPWAERAASELRASGESARRRDPSTARDLTAQERQVATLVRQGLTNRDAAAQLFVSPRTVDFHLRNVFTKLGISSRAELAALALD